jgi:hypothetical protein
MAPSRGTRVPVGFFSASLTSASISSGCDADVTTNSRPLSVTPILMSTPVLFSCPQEKHSPLAG